MIQEVIDRLKTSTLLSMVGGSAEIDPDINLQSVPAAFVVYGGERASDNMIMNAVQQQVIAQFAVLLAVRNVQDADGVESLKDLQPLRAEVKNLLISWSPNSECDPIIFRTGSLLQIDTSGVLWWVDTFETAFIERHL